MRTRTSYQPAWPVTGSLLLMVPVPKGSFSLIRWFSKKPLRDSSAPGASCQAPSALPQGPCARPPFYSPSLAYRIATPGSLTSA